MADATQFDPPPSAITAPSPAQDKVRLRFRKSGDLRWLSHHDLLRCFERMLRRANLPVHQTRGFHPHPRLVFALSLPLGVVGCEEVAELEMDERLPPEEIAHRLNAQTPPGLEILSVAPVPRKASAQVRSLSYRLSVPAERCPALQERLREVLAATEILVGRGEPSRGQIPLMTAESEPRCAASTINVRPFVRHLSLQEGALHIDLWLTPSGTARPMEILAVLGVTDLLEAGAVLERVRLELHDECPSHAEAHCREAEAPGAASPPTRNHA